MSDLDFLKDEPPMGAVHRYWYEHVLTDEQRDAYDNEWRRREQEAWNESVIDWENENTKNLAKIIGG